MWVTPAQRGGRSWAARFMRLRRHSHISPSRASSPTLRVGSRVRGRGPRSRIRFAKRIRWPTTVPAAAVRPGTRPVRGGGTWPGSTSPPPTATSRSTARRSTGRCASSTTTSVAMEDYVAADQRPLDQVPGRRGRLRPVRRDLRPPLRLHPRATTTPTGVRSPSWSTATPRPRGNPRLVFLLDPAAPWSPAWMDAFTGDGDQGGAHPSAARGVGPRAAGELLRHRRRAGPEGQRGRHQAARQPASTPTSWSRGCQRSQPGGRGRSRRRCARSPAATSSWPRCAPS